MEFSNKKITYFFNYLLIALFLIFLIVPMAGTVFGIEKNNEKNENRELATLPELNLNNFYHSSTIDAMENFLNDNFGFRGDLVRWNQLAYIKLFNTAPITSVVIDKKSNIENADQNTISNVLTESEDLNQPTVLGEETDNNSEEKNNNENLVKIQGDAIVGKDGWYYYAKEQIIDDYRGVIPFSSNQLEKIKSKLEEKKKWLNDQGIEFVVMVAPNKSSIYPEYMPETINKVHDKTRLDQFIEYMSANSNVTIIDPRANLIKAKDTNYVYEITGTHWNEFGAFIAYQELANYLNTIFPNIQPANISDYNVSTITAGGSDLAIMLSIQSYVQDQLVKLEPKNGYTAKDDEFLFEDPNPNPVMPLVAKKVDNPDLPKAVIFRDSFMKRLVPYLSEHFSRSSYVWTFEILPNVIEIEQPDVVIYEFVERKIEEVLLNIL